jgi:hypothetical protein
MYRLLLISLLISTLTVAPALADGKWDAFNGYMNGLGQDETLTQIRASDIIRTLQTSPKTVNELLDELNSAFESGEIKEDSLLAMNLRYALEGAAAKGFGTAKFDRWNYKYMKGTCGQREVVYYATATHANKKKLLMGFYLSAGPGAAFGNILLTKDLKLDCH